MMIFIIEMKCYKIFTYGDIRATKQWKVYALV